MVLRLSAIEDRSLVRVFRATPIAVEDQAGIDAACSLLDLDELERARRFRFDRDRLRFISGRALVRRSLSRYLDIGPADWRFNTGAYGRPEVSGPEEGRRLRFSVSRTDGLVVCAVAVGREIGVDLEKLKPYPAEVVKGFFSEAEISAVRQRDEPDRSKLFFNLWTLKEAYCKAKGLGLTLPVRNLSFDVSGPVPRLFIAPPLQDDSAAWHFTTFRPGDDYMAALCADVRVNPRISVKMERR